MNIDVLSFKRLAYRVFDELGITNLTVLEETGKNLVLRKLAAQEADKLGVIGRNLNRIGYISEVKSLLSELVQYNISPEELGRYIASGRLSDTLSDNSLYTVHLGGDEVPRGVWMGSPKCQELMKEKGMTKAHDLSEYFITQMADVMQKNGLKFSGWQEVALGHTEEAHQQLRGQAAGVYCWNTVPGSDEVVYQTANNGYPVILCNVGNFYMDMAYNGHPDERGLDWGGYVDESVSFSMLPFSIYRSLRVDMAGNPIDLDNAEKGKTALTEIGKKHIMGVQGQLFAETIRSFDGVEYLLFPKILGLAERGWNAHPVWENLSGMREQQAFQSGFGTLL